MSDVGFLPESREFNSLKNAHLRNELEAPQAVKRRVILVVQQVCLVFELLLHSLGQNKGSTMGKMRCPVGDIKTQLMVLLILLLAHSVEAFSIPHVTFQNRGHLSATTVKRKIVALQESSSSSFEGSLKNDTAAISMNSAPINGDMKDIQPKNGKDVNNEQQMPIPSNGKQETKEKSGKRKPSPTAPEVNKWTAIMSDGTNAAFNRGRDLYDGEEFEKEELEQIYKDLKDMSKSDREQVQEYWELLSPEVSYLGKASSGKVYDALRVAYRAHRGQMRKSGEPFIIHPVEVALLLAGLKMDAETVMSGLLHDTVEDTDLTFAQVEAIFGHVVRSIVEGETKVSKLPKLAFSDYADEQAENLRQMFVAMTDDYRIIIVKLADRLHNMRTLRHMKPEKQIKISRETLDIFAPLAHRMGIWQFKSELEDTAFMYLYPHEYKKLNRRLRVHQTKLRETLDQSQKALRKTLEGDPTLRGKASVQVSGRRKELYSLWHKMNSKEVQNLDHIVDVVALRVILTPNKNAEEAEKGNEADRGVWLCYHVLGLVQHLPGFQPMPTRVKDYISFPKPNGYQSLHTALMLNGQTIEVQIRTSSMHQVAEYGMASHWAYTDSKKRSNKDTGLYNTPWLSSIKEWQDDMVCSRDFVDSVRSELLGKRVFVFLRNGKILNLARGATAIDAAFQIHTEVGLTMHGAEINGKPVQLSYELQNGDVVSILTGEGKPATDWMRYAKSRSTRSKLRSYFRQKQKESLREAGKILILDYLMMHGSLIEEHSFLGDTLPDGVDVIPKTLDELEELLPYGKAQVKDVDDLLHSIGKKHDRLYLHQIVSKIFLVPLNILVEAEKDRASIVCNSVVAAVHESRRMARDAAKAAEQEQFSMPTVLTESDQFNSSAKLDLFLNDNEAIEYADHENLCQDCLPVLGDEIIGTAPSDDYCDEGTTVHRVACSHAQRAINEAAASKKSQSGNDVTEYIGRIDSVKLRTEARNRFSNNSISKFEDVPVKLKWQEEDASDSESDSDDNLKYLAEVIVVASDRKLLLADCSEIVSDMAEIMKTGSVTSDEHATLEFLVKVSSLQHLQRLMNKLNQVPSVMSVERRFGSDLL